MILDSAPSWRALLTEDILKVRPTEVAVFAITAMDSCHGDVYLLVKTQTSNVNDGSPDVVSQKYRRSRRTCVASHLADGTSYVHAKPRISACQPTQSRGDRARHRYPDQNETTIEQVPHAGSTRMQTRRALGCSFPAQETSTRQSPAHWVKPPLSKRCKAENTPRLHGGATVVEQAADRAFILSNCDMCASNYRTCICRAWSSLS
jgi:hypothetical protein